MIGTLAPSTMPALSAAPVDDELRLKVKNVRRSPLAQLLIVIATLAHDVEEENGALEGVTPIVENEIACD
jgi:hypothetical protein